MAGNGNGRGELHLRPYQAEALETVKDAYRAGKRRVLVSLPTGTGKTVVFAHFPRMLRMKKRLLVLAHREELLLQAQEKFLAVEPGLKVEIEQAQARASADARVVVASVATLARGGGTRLAGLRPDDFSIIVVDEAHHAVAPTYRRVLDHFDVFEPATARLLVGFTATPRRGDGQGLGEVFEEVCYARDLREMIADDYLAPITGWRVDSDVSLDDVKMRRGDFIEKQLAHAVNTPLRNQLLAQAYRELAHGRRAIVFCVDVAHAREVQRVFARAGVRAAAVWGKLPREERRMTLARFSNGELDAVTNCNVLTEGFDEPRVDCVIMARPTRSKLLYAQMVGRGTRKHPEKTDLLVIDVADNSRVHRLPRLDSLFGLPADMNLKGKDALLVEREIERTNRTWPWIDTTRIRSPDELELAAERIEFFNFEPPPELAGYTDNSWFAVPGGYRLSLAGGAWLSLTSNLLDTWDVEHGDAGAAGRRLVRAPDIARAVGTADRFVAAEFPDAAPLVKRDARWRDQPPTDKQLQLLARRGVPVPEGVTRGQAAHMIAVVVAAGRARGAR